MRPRSADSRTPVVSPTARSRCSALPPGGLSTRVIADQLFISPKTADHHIQHVYTRIGVSTRAAAALWAMQNRVVG